MRESEKRYRTVFETTGSATVIIKNDETISLANSTFEDLSGYSKEEIEDKISLINDKWKKVWGVMGEKEYGLGGA